MGLVAVTSRLRELRTIPNPHDNLALALMSCSADDSRHQKKSRRTER